MENTEINRLKKNIYNLEERTIRDNEQIAHLLDKIDKLTDECDGFRNGQAQLQTICNGLQDAIKKYADERKEMKAENERLKQELAAATFNSLPF